MQKASTRNNIYKTESSKQKGGKQYKEGLGYLYIFTSYPL